ncbi:MAG: DASS family sodium-coupled anion symporter [Flavobacteriales bacterium]|nr:DASS family sodium-coupled anion symporter [Flavobacteriales bacterium]
MEEVTNTSKLNTRRLGLLLGPGLYVLLMLASPDAFSQEAWAVIRVAIWMLVWWVSEAIPLGATSLLPILLFPLSGVMNIDDACKPYGSKFIFLFMGGFILALAMEKWNVHRRIALSVVRLTGSSANRIILGFMLSSWLLSMWISNTATTVMMLPIAASVIGLLVPQGEAMGKQQKRFALVMMLGIAYAANVGGIATLVGTPPNAAMAGALGEMHGIEIQFADWMFLALPFSVVMLFVVYFVLVKVIYPNRLGSFPRASELIQQEWEKLGSPTSEQRAVLIVFVMTAILWIFRSPIEQLLPAPLQLTDSGIAMFTAILLFVLPSRNESATPLLEWEDTTRLPWGILLLFGGGLSLANGFKSSGLIEMIATQFSSMGADDVFLLTVLLAFVALFLTEVMSNLALVNIFVPMVAALAIGGGESPLLFAVPVTIAASCAFMLPMSTPPNAIVFASGFIRIPQMVKAGIVLNLIAVVLVTLFCYLGLEQWISHYYH